MTRVLPIHKIFVYFLHDKMFPRITFFFFSIFSFHAMIGCGDCDFFLSSLLLYRLSIRLIRYRLLLFFAFSFRKIKQPKMKKNIEVTDASNTLRLIPRTGPLDHSSSRTLNVALLPTTHNTAEHNTLNESRE